MSVRSGSGASSRSTSFSLPSDARSAIRADRRSPGEEVEFDEEMDEECEFILFPIILFYFAEPIRLAAAKHAEFIRARVRHYSNEAEAMKVSIIDVNQCYMLLITVLLACGANG
jgi:protein phosphatase inhibitor 2